jgi:hypothetical protein
MKREELDALARAPAHHAGSRSMPPTMETIFRGRK